MSTTKTLEAKLKGFIGAPVDKVELIKKFAVCLDGPFESTADL